MALSNLAGWTEDKAASACGAACGAADKPAETPAACGAADKPADVLRELAPAAREMLNIPADHYMNLIVGFGYPEIRYARGVQKKRGGKIHRWTQRKSR